MRYGIVFFITLELCATDALKAKQCVGTIQGRVERANGGIELLPSLSNGPIDTVVLGPLDSLFISGEYTTPYCQFPNGTSLVIDHNGTQTVVPTIIGVNWDRPFTRLHEAGLYHIVQTVSVGWFDYNIPRQIFIVSEEIMTSSGAMPAPAPPLAIGYADGAVLLFGDLPDGAITLFASDGRTIAMARIQKGTTSRTVPVGLLPKGVYVAALDDLEGHRIIARFVAP